MWVLWSPHVSSRMSLNPGLHWSQLFGFSPPSVCKVLTKDLLSVVLTNWQKPLGVGLIIGRPLSVYNTTNTSITIMAFLMISLNICINISNINLVTKWKRVLFAQARMVSSLEENSKANESDIADDVQYDNCMRRIFLQESFCSWLKMINDDCVANTDLLLHRRLNWRGQRRGEILHTPEKIVF